MLFLSFVCLWRHKILRQPRAHAYQLPSSIIGAFEREKNRVNLHATFVNIATRFWRWKFKISNSYPVDLVNKQWRLPRFNCCLLCLLFSIFEASAVHVPWAHQTSKFVGELHPDSYPGFCVCSTNNVKDYKYVW